MFLIQNQEPVEAFGADGLHNAPGPKIQQMFNTGCDAGTRSRLLDRSAVAIFLSYARMTARVSEHWRRKT
jgi:hypothetical protein